MNITNPYGPNTTVLLPGTCNATCAFCFWDRKEAKIPFDHTYTAKVLSVLRDMPKEFIALSVSGGEPLVSPEFTRFCLGLIQSKSDLKFERYVLTTNGTKLGRHIDLIGATFNHLNISRHGIGSEENFKIFGTESVPDDAQLKKWIKRIHASTQLDVTLNCVVEPSVSVEFCHNYIKYAKGLGADAVSFRKVASDASPTRAEKIFRAHHKLVSETKCTVCRGVVLDVDGFDVRFKGSVEQPSIETNGVYEAVIHPDAKIYTDWSHKIPLVLPAAKRVIPIRDLGLTRQVFGGCGSSSVGGCGSSSVGGCGSSSVGGCGSSSVGGCGGR